MIRRIFTICLILSVCATFGGSAEAKPLAEGAPLPVFNATDMEGKEIDSARFAGKVLMLDFWSIYCSTCIKEMPHLVDLYNKYNPQGLEVIGVDLDPFPPKRIKKFLKGLDFTITYPNILDRKGKMKALMGVSMLPTTILVDTSGVVRLFHVGYKPGFEEKLEEKIKKLLPVAK
jgi:thiol-disulfide isomerase/thioredoxin